MARTMRELAHEALAVQDACNLCGVAQSFARAMRDLMDLLSSTKAVNEHPITVIWIDKLASLSGQQDATLPTMQIWSEVHRLAEEG